jgi:hypothetical protein
MENSSLDQAVLDTMNELMRASSDCAEFDPAMAAKFATAAKDLGRDLGITPLKDDPDDGDIGSAHDDDQDDEDDETRELLYLLDLQKKAVAATGGDLAPRNRLAWLGLDVWSRW